MNDLIQILGGEGVDIDKVKQEIDLAVLDAEEQEVERRAKELEVQAYDTPLQSSRGRSGKSSLKKGPGKS
jgi:hypothetical protein